ncbi:hypothetical protein [Streptomyces sp. ST2-7A]|uniref:hypothetical protein n=1 Tax=Streptomyces sp. ST2-7A TaxID=2907214 RepID=UPI001F303B8C|nr:hypothetical protein [Streptomyces sp. ST2-7A]MCE7082937.1 hypothetical protein [Streptomyces sp. ST2-7A]
MYGPALAATADVVLLAGPASLLTTSGADGLIAHLSGPGDAFLTTTAPALRRTAGPQTPGTLRTRLGLPHPASRYATPVRHAARPLRGAGGGTTNEERGTVDNSSPLPYIVW